MSNDQLNQSKEFTFGEIAMGLLLDTGPAQEEMQKFKQKCAEIAESVRGYFTGAFAAIKKSIADAFSNTSAISKLAKKLGNESIEDVSVFVNMLGLSGLSLDDSITTATDGFERLSGAINESEKGNLIFDNISLWDNNGELKGKLTLFNELRRVIQGIADETERANAIKSLDIGDPFSKLLNMDEVTYQSHLSAGAEHGVISAGVLKNAYELRAVLESMKQVWNDIGNIMLETFIPYLKESAQYVKALVKELRENEKSVFWMTLLFGTLAASMLAPFLMVFLKVTAVLVAVKLVYEFLLLIEETLARIFSSSFAEKVTKVFEWIGKQFLDLGLFLEKIFDSVGEFFLQNGLDLEKNFDYAGNFFFQVGRELEDMFEPIADSVVQMMAPFLDHLKDNYLGAMFQENAAMAIPPMAPLQTPKEMENNYGSAVNSNTADNSKTTNISQDNKIYVTVKDARDVQTVKTIMNQQATGLV